VALPNGMIVACRQKHEVPLIQLEVQSYFGNGMKLSAGDTVFDVGANIGLFSLAAYGHCGRDLRIFAFEPVAAIFELLKANCARNTAARHVKVFHCGLSHRAGTTELAYYPHAPTLSTAYPDPEADLRMVTDAVANGIIYLTEAPLALRCLRCLPAAPRERLIGWLLRRALVAEPATCQMRTLSEVVAEYDVRRIDLLKVDVEKAELDVLEGISRADWHKIQQVVVEVHDLERRVERTRALLVAAGMRSTIVDQPVTLRNSNIFTIFATRLH
jgi:FkbM family methyltransferase